MVTEKEAVTQVCYCEFCRNPKKKASKKFYDLYICDDCFKDGFFTNRKKYDWAEFIKEVSKKEVCDHCNKPVTKCMCQPEEVMDERGNCSHYQMIKGYRLFYQCRTCKEWRWECKCDIRYIWRHATRYPWLCRYCGKAECECIKEFDKKEYVNSNIAFLTLNEEARRMFKSFLEEKYKEELE